MTPRAAEQPVTEVLKHEGSKHERNFRVGRLPDIRNAEPRRRFTLPGEADATPPAEKMCYNGGRIQQLTSAAARKPIPRGSPRGRRIGQRSAAPGMIPSKERI